MRTGWERREALVGALSFALPLRALGQSITSTTPPPSASGPPAQTSSIEAPAAAAPPLATPPPSLSDLVVMDMAEDGARRMTTLARVNGRGPFPFLVDTGADHSVLSLELASALGLPSAGFVRVNGIAGSAIEPRASVAQLEVGGRVLKSTALALLPRSDLGALGAIGLDCLQNQSLAIDFQARTMAVRRSTFFHDDPTAIVVHGKFRFGQLMLVDSRVKRRPIYAVLDSGAQNTLGNPALRTLLQERRALEVGFAPDPARATVLQSVTGQLATGESDELPELVLGGVRMTHVPVVYADLHTFRMFKLETEPALLLGMDVLRAFGGVSIDFARRQVTFAILPQDPGIRTVSL